MLPKDVQTKKIPRPPNAFILYRAQKNHGQTLAEGEAKMDIRTLSKRIGEMWKSEPEGVQDKYYRRAIQAQLEHSRLYPDYKYQPKQNRKSRK
ncbi:hypothetical protein IE53DRAFT_321678, partial [Violaceomyces palustris]